MKLACRLAVLVLSLAILLCAKVSRHGVLAFGQPDDSTADAASAWPGERNANDIAGENNGTLRNGVTFQPGKVGLAFSFDGKNDFVDVGNVGISKEFPFSVTAWFQTPSPRGRPFGPATIYGEGGTNGRPVYQLWMGPDRRIRVYTKDDSGVVRRPLESPTAFVDGRFHHVAVVHKAKNDHQLYIDGILVDTSDVDIGTRTVSKSRIGSLRFRESHGDEQFWKGLIDEVQIFKRALTDAEVKQFALFRARLRL